MIGRLKLEANLMQPCVQRVCIHLDASKVDPISSVRVTAVSRMQTEQYVFSIDLEVTPVNDKNFEFDPPPSTGNQNNHNVADAQGEGSSRRPSSDQGPATGQP